MSDQSIHNKRIDYIEFQASDLVTIRKFYESVFNWQFEMFGDDYMAFRDGRITGGFYKTESVECGNPLVVIYAIDLEGMQASIVEQGGRVVKEIFEFPGGRRFHFADPNGNVLAVWSDK